MTSFHFVIRLEYFEQKFSASLRLFASKTVIFYISVNALTVHRLKIYLPDCTKDTTSKNLYTSSLRSIRIEKKRFLFPIKFQSPHHSLWKTVLAKTSKSVVLLDSWWSAIDKSENCFCIPRCSDSFLLVRSFCLTSSTKIPTNDILLKIFCVKWCHVCKSFGMR